MSLIIHRGGWSATRADLAAVPVPEATESYHPVPYGRFVEEVELHIPRFGLTWEKPRYEEFRPRTAWPLFNAFTEVRKGSGSRAQMDGSLRLRREVFAN